MDDHGSYLSVEFSRCAIDEGLLVVCVPPACHLIQPPNVECHGPICRDQGEAAIDHALALLVTLELCED